MARICSPWTAPGSNFAVHPCGSHGLGWHRAECGTPNSPVAWEQSGPYSRERVEGPERTRMQASARSRALAVTVVIAALATSGMAITPVPKNQVGGPQLASHGVV